MRIPNYDFGVALPLSMIDEVTVDKQARQFKKLVDAMHECIGTTIIYTYADDGVYIGHLSEEFHTTIRQHGISYITGKDIVALIAGGHNHKGALYKLYKAIPGRSLAFKVIMIEEDK